MWSLLEKTKELAAKMENQLNEAAGIEAQTSSAKTNDDALNDAWNDDFDDDAFVTNQPEAAVTAATPTTTPVMVEDNGGDSGGAWDEELNFDDSLEKDVVLHDKVLPPPIRNDSIASQLLEEQPAASAVAAEVTDPSIEEGTPCHGQEEEAAEPPLQKEPEQSAVVVVEHHEQELLEKTSISPGQQSVVEGGGQVPVIDETQTESEEALESDPIIVVEPHDEIPSKESSPVMVEQQSAAAWEEDLYDNADDDEDDEEDDDEEIEITAPATLAQPAASPPTTISIPSSNGSNNNSEQAVSAAEVEKLRQQYEMQLEHLHSQLHQTRKELNQREDQIAQKSQQMATMMVTHEAETDELRAKIKETKEEAKRRIIKAKERVEAMELAASKNALSGDDAMAKDETINALREEGQKLAKKQSEMEKAVRSALAEARELSALLEEEKAKKEKAMDKSASLEADLKKTKEELNAARRGESQATKLENELQAFKEEADRKEAINLSLQQQIKELKADNKELRKDIEAIQKGAMVESKRESNKLKKEHGELLSEMEVKLRAAEREASVREDALRTEVTEIRKRWQDAIRRADALSMDVQNSTAPLLRQLESMERHNRVRAAAWGELETKLRTDVENLVIENEKLTKERNEYKSSSNRLSRVSKERDDELSACKGLLEDQKIKIAKQEAQIEEMETEGRKMKEEWSEVERLANEGVSKVRSDMMKTVLESEERHQAQLKSIENELKEERNKRNLLERQVEEMLENAGMMVVPTPSSNAPNATVIPRSTQKKLRTADSQGSILTDAISGLNGDDADNDDADDDEDFDVVEAEHPQQTGTSSFAAMEQLNQRLKEAKVELETLRQSLASSERVRGSLLQELSETRVAKEKLPLFEAKVQELAVDNREKEMEIMALKDDIAEIRQLYRFQLNTLIEEKAATMSEISDRSRLQSAPEVFMTPMQTPPPTSRPHENQFESNGTSSAPAAPFAAAPLEPSKMD